MTVASGRLPDVADVGKKRPEAVFYNILDDNKDV